MNVEQARDVAQVGKTLSDATRVLIVASLAEGPRTVGALTTELRAPQPHVSSHLALLRMAGMVHPTPKGRERHYSLNREELAVMTRFLAGAKVCGLASIRLSRVTIKQAQDVARVGKTLSDATRVLILVGLENGPRAITALSDKLKLPHPAMSYHMLLLRTAGVVRRVRKGREVHYSLNREKLAVVSRFLAGLK